MRARAARAAVKRWAKAPSESFPGRARRLWQAARSRALGALDEGEITVWWDFCRKWYARRDEGILGAAVLTGARRA